MALRVSPASQIGCAVDRKTSPAAIVSTLPSARRSSKRPRSSSASQRPTKLAVRQPHPHLAADAAGAIEPVGADGRKAVAAAPLRKPPHHRAGQREKQIVGRKPWRRQPRDRSPDKTSAADGACSSRRSRSRLQAGVQLLALDQNAGELGAAAEHVIRPFQRESSAQSRVRDRGSRRERQGRRRTTIPARVAAAPDR